MRKPTIERVVGPTEPSRIALYAADAAAERAVTHLRSTEDVRFIRAWNTDRSPFPSLRICLADARLPGGTARLIKSRRLGALCVAVVAIDPTRTSTELTRLDRVFDAVLVVPIGPAADAELPLARAALALTASCTADRIGAPVDEVYPFLADGGRLRHGAAEAPSVEDAVRLAVTSARLDASPAPARVQLHIETSASDLLPELKAAMAQLDGLVRLDDILLSVSAAKEANRRASIVASVTPSKRPSRMPV